MPNVNFFLNNDTIGNLISFSYKSETETMIILRRLKNGEVSREDYKIEELDIMLNGAKLDYDLPILCKYLYSDIEFVGLVGRYNVVSINPDDTIQIVDSNLNWIKLKIDSKSMKRIERLISTKPDELYFNITRLGIGTITIKELRVEERNRGVGPFTPGESPY